MRTGISITITASQRRQLKAFVGDRNAPQKHVWRARIVLLSADRVGTVEISSWLGRHGKERDAESREDLAEPNAGEPGSGGLRLPRNTGRR